MTTTLKPMAVYAAEVQARLTATTERFDLIHICRDVCGEIVESLPHHTETCNFAVSVGQGTYRNGWHGVLLIDNDNNVFVESEPPADPILAARYRVITLEKMLQTARRNEASLRQATAHGSATLEESSGNHSRKGRTLQ